MCLLLNFIANVHFQILFGNKNFFQLRNDNAKLIKFPYQVSRLLTGQCLMREG